LTSFEDKSIFREELDGSPIDHEKERKHEYCTNTGSAFDVSDFVVLFFPESKDISR
jgi:hypothetical protein